MESMRRKKNFSFLAFEEFLKIVEGKLFIRDSTHSDEEKFYDFVKTCLIFVVGVFSLKRVLKS